MAAAALGACATPGHGADASATRRSRRLEVMWIVVVGSLGASHRGCVVLRAGRYCGSRRRSALLAPQKCVNDLRVCGRENVGEARHACGHELSQKDDAIERCLGFRVSCGRAADRHPMRRSGRNSRAHGQRRRTRDSSAESWKCLVCEAGDWVLTRPAQSRAGKPCERSSLFRKKSRVDPSNHFPRPSARRDHQ